MLDPSRCTNQTPITQKPAYYEPKQSHLITLNFHYPASYNTVSVMKQSFNPTNVYIE